MTELTGGGCACGAVRYRFAGEPVVTYKCYCTHCQRAGGSGYLPIMWVASRDFELLSGELRFYYAEGDAGRKVARGFCIECGSPVHGKIQVPGIVPIIASSLDEPDRYRASMQIWTGSARPWDALDPDLKSYETQFAADEVREWLKALRARKRQGRG